MNNKRPQFLLKLLPDLQDLTAVIQHPSALMHKHHMGKTKLIKKGKMIFLITTFCLFTCVYDNAAIDIMPELKRNILNFGYGVNFKYEGCFPTNLTDFM